MMQSSPLPSEKMMFQLNLRRRGISDKAVLKAMDDIPRELFVSALDREYAYRDTALGIDCGQTISQPFVVAYMTEQLQVRPEHRVLEIGTGSGYQAAVLSRLCREIVTIERFRTLADRPGSFSPSSIAAMSTSSLVMVWMCPKRSAPSTALW